MISNRSVALRCKESQRPDKTKFRGYWNLDEASGDALDSTPNALHLTETSGTIDSAEGGRDIEAGDTEYFARSGDDDLLSFGDEEMTLGCWVKLESQTASRIFISKYNTVNQRAYQLFYQSSTDRYVLGLDDTGTLPTNITADTYGAVPATTLAFVVAYHDPATNTMGISVNNGIVDTKSFTNGIFNNTARFTIGASWGGASAENFMDGIIKSAFVYAGLFSDMELAYMYNRGTPLKYVDI